MTIIPRVCQGHLLVPPSLLLTTHVRLRCLHLLLRFMAIQYELPKLRHCFWVVTEHPRNFHSYLLGLLAPGVGKAPLFTIQTRAGLSSELQVLIIEVFGELTLYFPN